MQFDDWFEKLTAKRAERLKIYQEDDIDKALEILDNIYGEKVHFVYELLQNADDAEASEVVFDLQRTKLIFSHNGKRHFNLTDPDLESDRSLPLGDINSITKYGNSTKTGKTNKIGKFGIGFKSVFQYTASPEIYDLSAEFPVAFSITDRTVPHRITNYPSDLKKGWTYFVIPFNNPKNKPETAFTNVSKKLQNLKYPTLFLNKIQHITYTFLDTVEQYSKEIIKSKIIDGVSVERVRVSSTLDGPISEEILMFSQLYNGKYRYSVAFGVDLETGCLKGLNGPAYCYFPVISENTNLNFLIHAPFLLTPPRDRIDVSNDDNHIKNQELICLLAKLAAKAILITKDLRTSSGDYVLKDSIIDILPIKNPDYYSRGLMEQVSYAPFYTELLNLFLTEEIIPVNGGYTSKIHAYWPSNTSIPKIFDDRKLSEITGDAQAKWVFINVPHSQYKTDEKTEYIRKLVQDCIEENHILNGFSEISRFAGITKEFIESQDIEWLFVFYDWLSRYDRYKQVAQRPVFLDNSGNAVPAYDQNGVLILFLPSSIESSFNILNEKLMDFEGATEVFSRMGFKEPDIVDEVYTNILPKYQNGISENANPDKDFKTILEAYCKLPRDQTAEFIQRINGTGFLWKVECADGPATIQCSARELIAPPENLKTYFAADRNFKFVDVNYYSQLTGELLSTINGFFKDMGTITGLEIQNITCNRTPHYIYEIGRFGHHSTTDLNKWELHEIPGFKACIERIVQDQNKELSLLAWNLLINLMSEHYSYKGFSSKLSTEHTYCYRTRKTETFPSEIECILKKSSWIVNSEGLFVKPEGLFLDSLSDVYDATSPAAIQLLTWLGINPKTKKQIEEESEANLSDVQKEKLKLSKFAEECNLTPEEAMAALRMAGAYKKQKEMQAANSTSSSEQTSSANTDLQAHDGGNRCSAPTSSSVDTMDKPDNEKDRSLAGSNNQSPIIKSGQKDDMRPASPHQQEHSVDNGSNSSNTQSDRLPSNLESQHHSTGNALNSTNRPVHTSPANEHQQTQGESTRHNASGSSSTNSDPDVKENNDNRSVHPWSNSGNQSSDEMSDPNDDVWFPPVAITDNSSGDKIDYDRTQPNRSMANLEKEYYNPDSSSKSIGSTVNVSKYPSIGRRKSINDVVTGVHKRTFVQNYAPVDRSKEITEDSDYYTRPPVDFSRRIELQEQKFAEDIQKLARMDYLSKSVAGLEKYSYGWFTSLLELESMLDENGKDEKVVSVTFSQFRPVLGSDNMYVLKYPNHQIPIHIEELSNFKLELTDNLGKLIPIKVEAASVRSFELYVRINKNSPRFDCNKIISGTIEVCSPKFLLDSLRLRYSELDLPEEYNFKDHLTKNIEFIFGPPGTGKTTYLATQYMKNWLNRSSYGPMLVLAPTNKATDVLTNRILSMVFDHKKRQRICRFGNTTDQEIINAGRFIERSLDIASLPAPIIITTVARFSYDHLLFNGKEVSFCDMHWDTIVVDEASMISIPQINYLLHKAKSANFVIAGDPFQIKPITQIEQWENENIYTMVELNEFNQSSTPLGHKVVNLSTQYRSVPEIGNLFAEFTYKGELKNDRKSKERLDLGLPNKLFDSSLNLIRFPVKQYESVYSPKALNKSPFHIYSALFTVELIRCVATHIRIPKRRVFTIGIISPYNAQATIIDKVLSTVDLPPNVKVLSDTVHSFQGDECDMIVLVLNPPPHIGNSDRMFVNNHNLLNVAISRARDYLVVLAPNEDTFGYGYLRKLKKIIDIMSTTGCLTEYDAKDLEEVLLEDRDFIENNTFTTNHQNVNVYEVPEKKYEVRSDKDALDVQVYERFV